MSTLEVVYDGKAFVPTTAVDLPMGAKCVVILKTIVRPAISAAEAERVLKDTGEQLPWATVEEALGHPKAISENGSIDTSIRECLSSKPAENTTLADSASVSPPRRAIRLSRTSFPILRHILGQPLTDLEIINAINMRSMPYLSKIDMHIFPSLLRQLGYVQDDQLWDWALSAAYWTRKVEAENRSSLYEFLRTAIETHNPDLLLQYPGSLSREKQLAEIEQSQKDLDKRKSILAEKCAKMRVVHHLFIGSFILEWSGVTSDSRNIESVVGFANNGLPIRIRYRRSGDTISFRYCESEKLVAIRAIEIAVEAVLSRHRVLEACTHSKEAILAIATFMLQHFGSRDNTSALEPALLDAMIARKEGAMSVCRNPLLDSGHKVKWGYYHGRWV